MAITDVRRPFSFLNAFCVPRCAADDQVKFAEIKTLNREGIHQEKEPVVLFRYRQVLHPRSFGLRARPPVNGSKHWCAREYREQFLGHPFGTPHLYKVIVYYRNLCHFTFVISVDQCI
jgi:hypothetical protein